MMGDLEAPKSMHVSLARDWPMNVRFPPNVGRSPNVRFPPIADIQQSELRFPLSARNRRSWPRLR